MMEDNCKNFKQNEVIEMKNKDDFHISVKDYSEAHRLTDKQRKIVLGTVTTANAIVDENGEKQISARVYSDYILFTLNDDSSIAKKLQSLDDLEVYEFLAREFLHEWTIIIGNISHLIAKGHDPESIDEKSKTLEKYIGDMRDMFEHLVDANKLYIEFGRASKDSPTGSKT